MGLFNLQNNIVQIDPDSLSIPQMKAIWDRDKNKNKETAYQELSYVYFLSDYKSPYNVYPEEVRADEIQKDFIRNTKWKPDELVVLAVKKYKELQETPAIKLLNAARGAVVKVTKYLLVKDMDDRNYSKELEKVGKIIDSLDRLEDKVKKDIKINEKIRGGGEIASRER